MGCRRYPVLRKVLVFSGKLAYEAKKGRNANRMKTPGVNAHGGIKDNDARVI